MGRGPGPGSPDPAKCGATTPWCSHPPPVPPPSPCPPPPPPSSPASHGRSPFVTALIVTSATIAVLALCLGVLLFVRRRRHRRRQREALLEAAAVGPAAAPPDDGGPGPGEEVLHHAWHIRTVGLDEAAIESIALTRYRAGCGGGGGASDCAVCLGEFRDGELLRLLPKCAHAFHVQCIDTWLRAHVNCPLCRAAVVDPAAAAAQPDPSTGADAEQDAGNIGTLEHEPPGQHGSEQQALRVQIDQRDQSGNSPERPQHQPGPRAQSFRRVASMDSPPPMASAEEPPGGEQDGGEKQGTGAAAVCCQGLSPAASGSPKNHRRMKRSLSAGSRWALVSRQRRTRSSSLLPL